jgi:hypothetical protein
MNEVDLLYMFETHAGRQIDKWSHYLDIYEKHFARFRGKSPRVLELGVDHGGSLQLWKRYFGPGAEIIGVDINPVSVFEEPGINVLVYDQCNPEFAKLGPWDIIIDDGSHNPEHQIKSFENLWPRCQGVYLIEDCHGVQPAVRCPNGLKFSYPWVYVYERPKRMIRGTPSRELREDEADARKLFGP